jgi:hypothetical protein
MFRQDDIEDYYHNTVQANMINWFLDNGVGVSVGIISNSFNGGDPVILNALKRCVSVGNDKCAVWNHGTDAAFRYGAAVSVDEAQQKLQACDTKIRTLLPGYQPFMMAPHQNSWNPFLIQALKNLNYKIVSASSLPYSGMTWDLNASPMQMPQQTTTGAFDDATKDFVEYPVASTIADCEKAAAAGQVCVIMTHPHEFANGAYNFDKLAQLVKGLKDAGFTTTNFYTVMAEKLGITWEPTMKPTTAPPTASPTFMPTAVPTTAAPTNLRAASSGLFSGPMNTAHISILAAVCFAIALFIMIVGCYFYRRWYGDNDSDSVRKRANTLTTLGSNEEMLSPSERFVVIELNNHYSLPRSDHDSVLILEDACINRHGLELPVVTLPGVKLTEVKLKEDKLSPDKVPSELENV